MTPACVVMVLALKLHPEERSYYPWTQRRECLIELLLDRERAECNAWGSSRGAICNPTEARRAYGEAIDRAHAIRKEMERRK
ncbi:MAG: hypothetical protein ACREFJ_12060 [Acetobacteraceae bacterium]